MRINEVVERVELSKRAVKYYEEKGLIKINKDENGYRNYTEKDIEVLEQISVYRKIDMDLNSIKNILTNPEIERKVLEDLYTKKKCDIENQKQQLLILEEMIHSREIKYRTLNQELDYTSIADSIKEMIPGVYGQMFMYHFLPYLNIPFETEEQRDAYNKIIEFWDNIEIKIPLSMRISNFINKSLMKNNIEEVTKKIDKTISMMLNPSEEEYEKTKKMIYSSYKIQNNFLYKYSIASIAKRKMMKELQRCGYNDIFIPNLKKLSPKYNEYHNALMNLNNRICDELGLKYDSNYNLIIDKNKQ